MECASWRRPQSSRRCTTPLPARDHAGCNARSSAGTLFTLVRMDQEYDFVMPHCGSLWVNSHPLARCGKEGSDRGGRNGARMLTEPRAGRKIRLLRPDARRRCASYRQMPAATDTFRLSTGTAHRQIRQLVTAFAGQAPQAFALGTQNQSQRTVQIRSRRDWQLRRRPDRRCESLARPATS